MVTLVDVAKKAGVSLATASYAMNGNKKIKEETRQRVLKAAEEIGYVPNAIARGLSAKRTKTIGLVASNISMPFSSEVIQCLEKDIRERGYNLLLGISRDNLELEKKIIEDFRERRVDGVIISPGHDSITVNKETDISHIHLLKRSNIPFIFINAFYPNIKASYVITDLEEGSYKLTSYLIQKGYRKIIFCVSKMQHYFSYIRFQGYNRAFNDIGINIEKNDPMIVECGDYSFHSAYETIKRWLENNDLPDVFTALNDTMALGILKALNEKGIRVPNDVKLAGYDDITYPTVSDISLTTVRIPISEISAKTVEVLISNIEGGNRTMQKILLEPELILRDSV